MDHPTLTPNEKKIVSEACGRLSAQLLGQVPRDRWPRVVLAVTVELADQVLRLWAEHDTERPPPKGPY